MKHANGLSRRHLLISLGAVAGGAAMSTGGTASAAASAGPVPTPWNSDFTQNGWPANVETQRFGVEGSTASAALLAGDVATVLLHVARRVNYEILSLADGHIHGQIDRNSKLAMPYESNYLSGTAFAVRADLFPVGSPGNLFSSQVALLRDILAECEGTVRWGGDDAQYPKEGHFQIDVPPGDAQLRKVAAKLQGWSENLGKGPGVPVDPFNKTRRSAALSLERKQKRK